MGLEKKPSLNTLKTLRYDVRSFNPSECSDVIRLTGQWVEGRPDKGIGPAVITVNGEKIDLNELKKTYRKGTVPRPEVTGWMRELQNVLGGGSANLRAEAEQEAVWDQKVGGRKRGIDPLAPKFKEKGKEYMKIPEYIEKERIFPGKFAGMWLKRPVAESTILKIDSLFGLLPACDISGTTCDSTSVMELCNSMLEKGIPLTSSYYLLPLATIVANCHHSILEVALPLALNGINDYRIGFYSTLFPTTGEKWTIPELKATLEQYERNKENQHFLCWHEGITSKPNRCLLFEKEDIDLLKETDLFNAKRLLAAAQKMESRPKREDVIKLFADLAPQFARYLPDYLRSWRRLFFSREPSID